MRYDKSHHVGWHYVIASETLGVGPGDKGWGKETSAVLLTALREILTEFIQHRSRIGLRNVLYDHGVWMRGHSWFVENVERYGSSSGPGDGSGSP